VAQYLEESPVHGNNLSGFIKSEKFLEGLTNYQPLK